MINSKALSSNSQNLYKGLPSSFHCRQTQKMLVSAKGMTLVVSPEVLVAINKVKFWKRKQYSRSEIIGVKFVSPYYDFCVVKPIVLVGCDHRRDHCSSWSLTKTFAIKCAIISAAYRFTSRSSLSDVNMSVHLIKHDWFNDPGRTVLIESS